MSNSSRQPDHFQRLGYIHAISLASAFIMANCASQKSESIGLTRVGDKWYNTRQFHLDRADNRLPER